MDLYWLAKAELDITTHETAAWVETPCLCIEINEIADSSSCYTEPRPRHVGHGTGISPLPLQGTQMRAKGSFLLGS